MLPVESLILQLHAYLYASKVFLLAKGTNIYVIRRHVRKVSSTWCKQTDLTTIHDMIILEHRDFPESFAAIFIWWGSNIQQTMTFMLLGIHAQNLSNKCLHVIMVESIYMGLKVYQNQRLVKFYMIMLIAV